MSDLPTNVFHYTSTSVLKSIVENEEFWLGNVFFMNDYLEVNWLFTLAKDILRNESKKAYKVISNKTYPSEPGTVTSSSSMSVSLSHSQYYSELGRHLESVEFAHIYCGCFSQGDESRDDLSQWRGYADDAQGVRLELDLNLIHEANSSCSTILDWREVLYDRGEHEREILKTIQGYCDMIDNKGTITSSDPNELARQAHYSLSLMATGYKNPKFLSEREFRLVVRLNDASDPTQCDPSEFDGFPNPIHFVDREGVVVPYTKIRLPHEAIKGVMLGPRFGNKEVEAGLKFFMSMNDLNESRVPISRSAASYR